MKISQVAAQLYTLRDQCKTEADIAFSLERVRKIGYQAVQASGLGPISEDRLLQLCRDNGLTLCATHESLSSLLDTPDQIIERLHKLGCKHTALGSPGGVDLGSREGVMDYCRRVDEAAQKFAAAGISLSHHNHHFEFRKLGDKPVLQLILENTRHLTFEIDTYWVQYGGANPESFVKLAAGRLPLLHLKDYAIGADNTPDFAEIGSGNLEFPAIIAAAKQSGCEWFIVEQDTTPADPFDSLQISFNYIRDHLCA
ncbi:sugar phosphate isomerase/epimerase family protein [Abditibacterium utsteinense]|nr:sugar phosphate isomerase/epimerase [Abditibacterium utsteinense]